MNTLWNPWRMEHVLGQAPPVQGCLFEPAGLEKQDKKYLLLYQDNLVVVLLNRFPYTNGHLLVAPERHVSCLSQLDKTESDTLMSMLISSQQILQKKLNPDGLNVGCNIGSAAGAGIADHVHFHIVPRWKDDHNFMTVIGEIRTIPEHIDLTYDKLAPDFLSL